LSGTAFIGQYDSQIFDTGVGSTQYCSMYFGRTCIFPYY